MSKYNDVKMHDNDPDGKPLKATALKYDKTRNNAPCVIASGTGYAAERIIQMGMENGIMIYHDDNAASLLANLELGQEIPEELYQIVVNIYMHLLETAEEHTINTENKFKSE